MYVLLFRVEASDAPNSASNAGAGSVRSGAVAGFPMPTLRYYVGNSSNADLQSITDSTVSSDEFTDRSLPIFLRWKQIGGAKFYRLEILDEDRKVFSAIILPSAEKYRLPPFIGELAASKPLRWKTLAIGENNKILDESGFSDVK